MHSHTHKKPWAIYRCLCKIHWEGKELVEVIRCSPRGETGGHVFWRALKGATVHAGGIARALAAHMEKRRGGDDPKGRPEDSAF